MGDPKTPEHPAPQPSPARPDDAPAEQDPRTGVPGTPDIPSPHPTCPGTDDRGSGA